MAALNAQRTLTFGITLLIAALMTMALGISSIAIHQWSQAGATATFAGAVLVFTGALAIHVSKTRTRIRINLLLGSSAVACLSTVVMVSVCALSIRKDCDDREVLLNNPAATDSNRTLATCIVVIDGLILLVGLLDLIPALVLAHTCMNAFEQMAKVSNLMVLEPFQNAETQNGQSATLENGFVHHEQSHETKIETDKSIYVKTHYCNKCNESLSNSVLALHIDENSEETKTKKEKEAKVPKEKKVKEKKPKEEKEKKNKKKKMSINPEELEAVESINIAVANYDLDHEEPTQEAEKPETDEIPEIPNYDLPDQGTSPESIEPREMYTTDEEITRYNPVFNPTVVPQPEPLTAEAVVAVTEPEPETVVAETVVEDETQPLSVAVVEPEVVAPDVVEPEVVAPDVVEPEMVAPDVEPEVEEPEIISPVESLPPTPIDTVVPDVPNTEIEADIHIPENDVGTEVTMATETEEVVLPKKKKVPTATLR